MNAASFCTISTLDYLPYVRALYDSLARFNPEVVLSVFISDAPSVSIENIPAPPGMLLYGSDDLCAEGLGRKIRDKYQAVSMDAFRWSMKPVFLKYLLEHTVSERIIYVDNDIFFFNDYAFLFDELGTSDVILTPHWRTCDPHIDHTNFFTLYTSGLYNGGFIGTTRHGVSALDWWAMACLYVCEKNAGRGQFVDQTHLNLLPIYFENVKIIRHRGCNVANWNRIECERVHKAGSVLINGKAPIVFIHFTHSTIKGIIKGDDALLAPFLETYRRTLEKYGVRLPSGADDMPPAASNRRAAGAKTGLLQRMRALFNG